jgi:hypothetical protein
MGWLDRFILKDEPAVDATGSVSVSANSMKFHELVKKLEPLFEARYGLQALSPNTQNAIASVSSALSISAKSAGDRVDELVQKINFAAIARDALAYHRTVRHEISADGKKVTAGQDLENAGRQDFLLNEMIGDVHAPTVKTTILKGVPKAAIIAAQINVAKRLMAVDIAAGTFPAAQKTFNAKSGDFDRVESPMAVKAGQSPHTAIKYFNSYFGYTHKPGGTWAKGANPSQEVLKGANPTPEEMQGSQSSLHLLQWAKAKWGDQIGQAGQMAAESQIFSVQPTEMRDNLDLLTEIFRDNLIHDGLQESVVRGAAKFAERTSEPADRAWRNMIVHRCYYAIASKPYLQAQDADMARVADINYRLCGQDVAFLIAAQAIMNQAVGQSTGMSLAQPQVAGVSPPLQPLAQPAIPAIVAATTANPIGQQSHTSGQVIQSASMPLGELSNGSIFALETYQKGRGEKTISALFGDLYMQSQKDKRGAKPLTAEQQANLNILSGQLSLFADLIVAPKFRETVYGILRDNPGSAQANLIRTSFAKAVMDGINKFGSAFER